MFKDFKGRDVSNCIACHDDVHEQKFGNDCRQCHSEESFQSVRNFTALDHVNTDFPLEGKHTTVDCRKCHEQKMTEPLPFNACAVCHDDYHDGQFVTDLRSPDCASCHTVDGFEGSTFTIAQHNETRFALTGAHLATPCFSCHLREDQWMFRNIGENCIDCHANVHGESVEIKFVPDQACAYCHNTEQWASVTFDHTQTGFPLEGAHAREACIACHLSAPPDDDFRVIFTGLSNDCNSCHENVHRSQFAINGVTDCRRCHHPDQWSPSDFDHNTARFPLEGAHAGLSCIACHTQTMDSQGTFVLYSLGTVQCVDCHQ
jgi:nitrate/TMAO reductase-like tetraheme cytochrome c subunit